MDAARVLRRPYHAPALAGVFHLDHRHAVRVLRFQHLVGIPFLHAVDVQQAVVGVFVVHRQQAVLGAGGGQRQREVAHAVMVHAGLDFLLGGRVGRVLLERRQIALDADRVAPGVQHVGAVAFRHHHAVVAGERDGLEAQQRRLLGKRHAGGFS
ncbi:hypothetical protein D3C85_1309110 [compost metagenome]